MNGKSKMVDIYEHIIDHDLQQKYLSHLRMGDGVNVQFLTHIMRDA